MFANLSPDDYRMKVLSVILGLGFASFFRTVCISDKCKVIRGPNIKDVNKNLYRIDEKCYKYKPSATMCD